MKYLESISMQNNRELVLLREDRRDSSLRVDIAVIRARKYYADINFKKKKANYKLHRRCPTRNICDWKPPTSAPEALSADTALL